MCVCMCVSACVRVCVCASVCMCAYTNYRHIRGRTHTSGHTQTHP